MGGYLKESCYMSNLYRYERFLKGAIFIRQKIYGER